MTAEPWWFKVVTVKNEACYPSQDGGQFSQPVIFPSYLNIFRGLKIIKLLGDLPAKSFDPKNSEKNP